MDIVFRVVLSVLVYRVFVALFAGALIFIGFRLFRARETGQDDRVRLRSKKWEVDLMGGVGALLMLLGAAVLLIGMWKPPRVDFGGVSIQARSEEYIPGDWAMGVAEPEYAVIGSIGGCPLLGVWAPPIGTVTPVLDSLTARTGPGREFSPHPVGVLGAVELTVLDECGGWLQVRTVPPEEIAELLTVTKDNTFWVEADSLRFE